LRKANEREQKAYTPPASDGEVPDLPAPYWADKFAAATVQRGRPKADITKVSTTTQLDPDIIKAFKAEGAGWQSRINDALRKAVGL